MESPAKDGPVVPVLIKDSNGKVLLMALTNTKGRLKSLEQGEPWLIDGESGRLLPLSQRFRALSGFGAFLQQIEDRNGGLTFIVSPSASDVLDEIAEGRGNAHTIDPYRSEGTAPNDLTRGSEKPSDETGSMGPVAGTSLLFELEKLVKERRHLMPEGSYTTHLFSKGLAKIRKKTGEEAIELLLAETADEAAGEAADLLYHVIVLLVALELPLERVFEELKKR